LARNPPGPELTTWENKSGATELPSMLSGICTVVES
jgi:hypothetical protein